MHGSEGWAIKKAEHWRTDAFELWCLRRLLRVPWTARRSCQSILKEINPEYSGRTDAESWSWSFNTLATWCKELTLEFQQNPGKDSAAGKDGGQEEKGATEDEMVGWHHQLNGHEFERTAGDSEGQEDWCAAVHGLAKSQKWLSNWTTTTCFPNFKGQSKLLKPIQNPFLMN